MTPLPSTERILLGPGPSMTSPRVMRAMAAPTLGHLDPLLLAMMDEIRERLAHVFQAGEGAFAFAVSGTGTSGLEAVVANLVEDGTRVLNVVNGYFGDRLSNVCARYGAQVARVEGEWGRAIDPDAVRAAIKRDGADLVAIVHAETSTGVLNPVDQVAAIARDAGAMTMVDAVTSLGAMRVDVAGWGADACYSCTQKGLGGPSGMAPVVFSARAVERRVPCRSFYLDLQLLEDYWVRRKYHHTISATLIYALREALLVVEEEGLEARWERHRRNHLMLAAGLRAMGIGLLPPEGERLWTLNAVVVPEGVNEAAVRKHLLERFGMEIGAGLGPLAGRIWRVGLMGSSSTPQLVLLFLAALEEALARNGCFVPGGAGTAAAVEFLRQQ
jgi:alanine-glyoxylate transaminase/serine-glyoxylate transaminase/serine-pyruvate transaminase